MDNKKEEKIDDNKNFGSASPIITNNYALFINDVLKNNIEPITLEEPNLENKDKFIILRDCDQKQTPYDITVLKLLIDQGKKTNPLTNEVLPEYFFTRFNISYRIYELGIQKPKYSEIKKLFLKFLDNKCSGLNEIELLILKKFLTMDVQDHIFNDIMATKDRSEFRSKTVKLLEKCSPGSWILRPSSIEDDEKTGKYCRIMSVKISDNLIKHAPLIHILSEGIFLVQKMTSSSNINNFNYKDNKEYNEVYANLIDLLIVNSKKNYFHPEKYLKF